MEIYRNFQGNHDFREMCGKYNMKLFSFVGPNITIIRMLACFVRITPKNI